MKTDPVQSGYGCLQELIRGKIYPPDRYPDLQFPDLVPLLMDVLEKDPRYRNRVGRQLKKTHTLSDMSQKVIETILCFENLLQRYPAAVVMMHRRLIERFIQARHPARHEREDLVQEIITRLISTKMERIKQHFRFSEADFTSFTSYFMVTIRNIHIDILRERNMEMRKRESRPVNQTDISRTYPEHEIGGLILKEEFDKFSLLIQLFHHLAPRLELCLMIKFRIPPSPEDIRRCFPGINPEDMSRLRKNYAALRDRQVFEKLTPIFNRYETKTNKGDTVRKWISVKLDEIIRHMNNTHPHPVYTAQNIQDLVTMYYQDRADSARRIRHGT